jgi:hypothetical protein
LLASVAHAYHPSYSGGRDQEDRGLKPAQAKVLKIPSRKNPSQKLLVEWVKALSSNPSTTKKKKKQPSYL